MRCAANQSKKWVFVVLAIFGGNLREATFALDLRIWNRTDVRRFWRSCLEDYSGGRIFDAKRDTSGALTGTLRAEIRDTSCPNPGHFEQARIVASKKCQTDVSRNVSRLKRLQFLSIFFKTTFRDTSTTYL